MRNRGFRPIAAVLGILLLTNVPAQAGPIAISEVIQVLGTYENTPEIRLRGVSQNSREVASGIRGSVQTAVRQSSGDESLGINDILTNSSAGISNPNSDDTLFSGVVLASDPQVTVDVIDQGEVEGTVCDCGEITVPGGGFPKWPLLFLAAIPLFFIHECDDCNIPPPPPPTPSPTPTPPIPEPASLFLFGTGLLAFGASLRRRYAKGNLAAQIDSTEED